jgi:phage baseplate assembly protein W
MSGISVKLPLHTTAEDGHYALNKTFLEVTKQNFKNLLLTNPGEKIMDPSFGVGVSALLFEQDVSETRDAIVSKIHQQVKAYLPHVVIEDLLFVGPEFSPDISPNSLRLTIQYRILPLNQSDLLDINIE